VSPTKAKAAIKDFRILISIPFVHGVIH